MDKLIEAKTLLKTLRSFKGPIEVHEKQHGTPFYPSEKYMQILNDRLENVIRVGIETFDNDERFLKNMIDGTGEVDEIDSIELQSEILIDYLETYLEPRRPMYMDDLLQYAEKFVEERLYNNAAFSIRLYSETCLKMKLENYDFIKGKSFGWNWTESKKRGLISEELFDKHKPSIDELNDKVHNHVGNKYCPETDKALTGLIKWARDYESELESLNLES